MDLVESPDVESLDVENLSLDDKRTSYRIRYKDYESEDIRMTDEEYQGFAICVSKFSPNDFKVFEIDHEADEFIEMDFETPELDFSCWLEEVNETNYNDYSWIDEGVKQKQIALIGDNKGNGIQVLFNDDDFIRGCEFYCSFTDDKVNDILHEWRNIED